MRDFVFLFLAAMAASAPCAERGKSADIASLVKADLKNEVRPGDVNGSPFWNSNSRFFMYPPAFDFPTDARAACYRFDIVDANGKCHCFEAHRPTASLSPVWENLPTGWTTVSCRSVDKREGRHMLKGCRVFWKQAPFTGNYPPAARGYRECADLAIGWIFKQPSWKKFMSTRDAADCGYWGFVYPSKMVAALVSALCGGAADEERIAAARLCADWLISISEGPDRPLAYFPPTYHSGDPAKAQGVVKEYWGQVMLIYPAAFGKALVSLYTVTKDEKCLVQAKGIAETYLKLQGEDGTWPLKMDTNTGREVKPNRLMPIASVMPFLDALHAVTGDGRYLAAADRAFAYIENGPLKTWNWEGQFEDVGPDGAYRNLTKHDACATALYICKRYPDDKARLAVARDILRFAEDQFVCWEKPFPDYPFAHDTQDVANWVLPGVMEQYYWFVPIDASAAKLIRTYLALYRAEGNPLDLAKAKALGDAMTRMQKPDGDIPTHWHGEKSCSWWNCLLADVDAMNELADVSAPGPLFASGDPFIEQLLAKMTLEEKVGQCVQLSTLGAKGATDFESNAADGNSVPKDAAAWVRNGEVGSLIGCCGVGKFNAFQKIAREESRLGIPLMVGHDMIHGVKTQFPIGPALACLWDEAAWEACGRLIALETPLKGCNWTFAPMLDIARDPRWGRIAEGPGQDPLIGARMGAALVRGIQSKDVDFPVAACIKHYVGYGAAFAGRDYFAVEMSESTLRNVYLPPFKAAVAAGALTVMPAFHTFNGVPCSVNRWLLTDILRKELGFSGFCISDWNAVDECQRPGCHGLAENNNVDASALAVHAGMDMDMMSGAYQKGLVQAVKSGKLPLAELDEAVRRILSVKKALNLWEKPYIDERAVAARVDLKAHAALARDVGARCCVLLKNENRTLPLRKGAKVLLVGPGATDVRSLSGAWTSFVENPSCMLLTEGLKDCGVDFTSVPGYDFRKPGVDTAAIDAAAAEADVIVAIFGESGRASGEGQSYLRMELPPVQLEALRHLKTLKKPLVALLSGGRPRAIPELAAEADAILDVWSLGTSAGGAMADVLTGKVNPEGRLTVEIPYATGQLPLFYNRTASGRPAVEIGQTCASCYKDGPFQALYPFGYGLSYTTFAYANEKVSVRGDKVVFEADVTNTGNVEGVETVQAYTRDLVGVESRPVRELRGWRRLKLKPGETRHAEIVVPVADLGYWAGSRFVSADGEHWAWIAHDSVSGKKCAFTLSGMR